MDWSLYDRDLPHESVKKQLQNARKFFKRKNNNKVDSIVTGCLVIAYSWCFFSNWEWDKKNLLFSVTWQKFECINTFYLRKIFDALLFREKYSSYAPILPFLSHLFKDGWKWALMNRINQRNQLKSQKHENLIDIKKLQATWAHVIKRLNIYLTHHASGNNNVNHIEQNLL